MDTSRLSIARLLELDVPFEWQDAVAVVQEVAMLSDVHAAMYNRPSLVSLEHCYITRAGSIELPETTDVESPDAVPELLRVMLAGREVPEALEDLAFSGGTRDMTGALAEFPVGNRRAVIAKLAARALTAAAAPPTPGFGLPERPVDDTLRAAVPVAPEATDWSDAPTVVIAPPANASRPLPTESPSHVQEAVALARETFRPVLVQPAARPPFTAPTEPAAGVPLTPPFVATPPFSAASTASASRATAATATASAEIEFERLRRRAAARAEVRQRWRERLGALVTWRPSFPDPRILGTAAIVTAALVSVVWRNGWPSMLRPSVTATNVASEATAHPPQAPAASAGAVASPANAGTTAAAPVPVPAPRASSTAARGPSAAAATAAPTSRAVPNRPPRLATATPRIVIPAASLPHGEPGALDAPTAVAPLPAATPRFEPGRDAGAATPAAATAPPPPSVEPRAAIPAERDAPANALYSSNDLGVVPPVIRRQHLPSNLLEAPAEVSDDWPYLELLIDTRGAVEQVRLHARQLAPGQTLYRHRMLLAAAKAWQFEPARRNGEAVRYLMRVPLEP